MGRIYKQNFPEIVKIGDVELPIAVQVQVSEGGKVIVKHNGIKEQTGWKDRKVKIWGRLEGEGDTDDEKEESIQGHIKNIKALGRKEEALTIVSKTTDNEGIKKIVLEDDPAITVIQDFYYSRNLVITGWEDEETENSDELAKKKKEDKEQITESKKKEPEKETTVKKGDTLSKLAAKNYGNAQLWEVIYQANKDTVGPDPNKIIPGQNLVIPKLKTEDWEYTVKKGDSYNSIAKSEYTVVRYAGKIKKANDYQTLVEGDILTIPALQSQEEKNFAGK